ncbi:eCIS core domain-containing protein [Methanosarcina sp. Mfa9]|uniref:eCIS core domain-containing protein n=1 Tax=Methanosarcina sp. Mfa9 TaxID=3439063 RepID=UPI003F8323C6
MESACKVHAKTQNDKSVNSISQSRNNGCRSVNSPAEKIMFLQRTAGNQAVQRLIKSGALQAKLRVGQPNDIYEQEADRVAEQVMSMPEPQAASSGTLSIQRTCPGCEEEKLRRQPIKEEEEKEELLQTKEISGQNAETTPGLESRINAIRGGGQPLAESERSFFEPRFGYDFSQVRVHIDEQAAQAVNARAFTVGNDIVFEAGQYVPGTTAGRQLLAHELTHTVQQGADQGGYIQRFVCEMGIDCPTRNPGEVSASRRSAGNVETTSTYEYVITDFAVDSARLKQSVRDHSTMQLIIRSLESDPTLRYEVAGYSDCIGPDVRNRTLRRERAQSVWDFLPGTIRSRGTLRGGAPLHDCVDSNASQAGRARNRSVIIKLRTVIEGEEIIIDPCAPSVIPSQAASFVQYVGLIRCAERAFPGYSPRQMLSLMRQIYYGHEPWSRTRTRFWQNVIPCGLNIPDPRTTLGNTLFQSLRNSNVISGTDMGHVFTGLESMLCPTPTVELEVFGPNPVVNMPNEEFATWGGDLGSAAAHRVHDEVDSGILHPWSYYYGQAGRYAGFDDLRGDIDSYVIRKGLTGIACAETPQTRIPSISAPVSQILHQYYTAAATPVGRTRTNRFRCFAQALGGRISGRSITNKSSLILPIRVRVESFARTFYFGLVRRPFAIGVLQGMKLLQYSWEITERFLDWVESRL